MAEPSGLAEEFERLRPELTHFSYTMIGSLSEAEDIVQEAWLRLERTLARGEAIRDLKAWLTRVVARLSLDAYRVAQRRRRETYIGEWLPEPLVKEAAFSEQGWSVDPADRVTLDDSVTMALLVVLETLSPAERAAFVMHDVFGMPFAELAELLGRSEQSVRQLASRARRRVEEGTPRFPVTPQQHQSVVAAFATAAGNGDIEGLLEVLDPEVVFRSDGGGHVAATGKPLQGADRVARALLALDRARRRAGRSLRGAPVWVNGSLGLVLDDEISLSVYSFTLDQGRITAIDVVRNPEKLSDVPLPSETID
jgi:RNA polymerase sigma-70 factor (ECF subfamily)